MHITTQPSIILIDDSPGERELFRLALAQTGLDVTLYTEQDSDAAFHFLDHRAANVPGCPPGEVTGVVSSARVKRSLFIWSILSIWFVWLVRRETLPEEPDRPERPANQTDHRARSASTETMPDASHSSTSISIQEGGLNRSPTARIEGAHSDRAASASTGDRSGLPSLILLDLNLRGQNGCDLLKRLRSDARFAALPVVVFTTSDDPADLAHSYSCGTNGYVVKPGSFDALVRCTTDLCRNWLTWNRPSMSDTAC